MPNKSSSSVNGLRKRRSPGAFNVLLSGLVCAALAAIGLVSGGLGSPVVAGLALYPVLAGLLFGGASARVATVCALTALVVLTFMAFVEWVPEPLAPLQVISGWLLASLGALTGLVYLLRGQRGEAPNGHDAARAKLDDRGLDEVGLDELGLAGADSPYLYLSVTPLGRIRALSGNAELLPGARIGRELAVLMAASGTEPAAQARDEAGEHVVFLSGVNADRAGPLIEDVSGLAHDLKSPLGAILGFSEMMADAAGTLPKRFNDYPGLIHEAGETLQDRVETLLALLRADHGALPIRLRDLDLVALTDAALAPLAPMAQARGVALKRVGSSPVKAHADADATGRIVENLVSNAIKYAPEGGSVQIELNVEADGMACLSVTDQGTGIGAADLARLAEPFVQGTHTQSREGTGLGLALVKRLVALQGGELRIRSAEGHGTQMLVRLPAGRAMAKAQAAE